MKKLTCDVKSGWCICGDFHRPKTLPKATPPTPVPSHNVKVKWPTLRVQHPRRTGWMSVKEMLRQG